MDEALAKELGEAYIYFRRFVAETSGDVFGEGQRNIVLGLLAAYSRIKAGSSNLR